MTRYAWLLLVAACGSPEPSGNDGGTDDSGSTTDTGSGSDAPATTDGTTSDVVQTQDSGGGALPLAIPGVAVWLRADHVQKDGSGNVAVWTDMTTNHNDFTPSGGHPPVLATAANGQPAVDMTTIATCTGHATPVGTGPVLVEIVAGSIQKTFSVMTATSPGNNVLAITTSNNGSARAEESSNNLVVSASSSVAVNDGQWHNLAVQVASSQLSLRHAGLLVAGPAPNATFDLGSLDTTNIGGDAVAEFIVVVGAISSSDLGALESYLKTRYQL